MSLLQMAVEPPHQPPRYVPLMFLLCDAVAFVWVDDELRFDADSLQRVPELEGLWRGTFAVAFTDQDEGRGLRVLDECDRCAAGVDRRVIVNGRAEVGDH